MKPLPTELSNKIDEIRTWMFNGGQKELARRARVSEARVSLFLNKKIPPTISLLDEGLKLMNERKAKWEINPNMKVA